MQSKIKEIEELKAVNDYNKQEAQKLVLENQQAYKESILEFKTKFESLTKYKQDLEVIVARKIGFNGESQENTDKCMRTLLK